ncbi:MAG TPA: DHA2 family efflux MFS transporter permease subunit [Solirubrobacteraceae bacterium]|nr:DHA2 family efflux MFS transporter permease subunit [Solirubrobacteraceae bacterium]
MAHRWKVLVVVSVAVFVVGLDLFIVNVSFPQIERAFSGASVASVSWVLSAYAIVLAALMVPAGRWADRYGRRRLFLVGMAVFVASSALCGVAGALWLLISARVLQAVGAAFMLPTSLALLLPEFPPAERSAAIGVWASVGGIAAALGPPLGGLLVGVSWRLVFYVNVPVGLVALAFAWRLLSETRDETQQRPDLLGALLLIGAVALLALGLVKAPSWHWGDTRTLASLVAGIVGLLAFWVRCQSHSSPIIEPALLRVRSFALANAAAVLFSASFAAMLLGCVLFMTDVWHYSTLTAGFALSPGPLMAAIFAPPAGRLAGRVGQAMIGALGIGVFAAGCAWWLWRADASATYPLAMLPGLLITGIGVGLTLPALASTAAASLPPQRFATGAAIYTMARQFGFALGVAILVAVLGTSSKPDGVASFNRGWLFMIVSASVASGLAAAIGTVRQYVPVDRTARVTPSTAERSVLADVHTS